MLCRSNCVRPRDVYSRWGEVNEGLMSPNFLKYMMAKFTPYSTLGTHSSNIQTQEHALIYTTRSYYVAIILPRTPQPRVGVRLATPHTAPHTLA